MSRSWEDRVDEYVDSPRMRERIKDGSTVICRIQGNSGVYRTEASVGRKKASDCTCPSEYVPCKHVAALLETYQRNPRSFVDLDQVLKQLEKRDPKELLGVVRQMARETPSVLAVLGVKGFQKLDEYDPEEEGW
ncbi:MAG: SWIM zinc finger family protein [Thermoplasmata archaeon]